MKNTNKTNNKCLITYDATRAIRQDSDTFTVETGGALIGTPTDPLAIVAAGLSGDNSLHHATSFTSDPRADSKCLEAARRKHGNAMIILGYWHKHPSGFERPSIGDCRQVQLLKDEYNDGKPVLMGIVSKKSSFACRKLSLRLFSLDPEGQLLKHSCQLVSGSSKELLEAISKAPVKPEARDIEFWKDPDFQFYLNPIGRDRIVREARALKQAGWSVITTRRKSDEVMLLELTKGSTQLHFEFPPEFPLNPPTVLTREGNRLECLDTLWAWNSRCCLTEVAAEAENIRNFRKRFLTTP